MLDKSMTDAELIEKLAWVMCQADGQDPDAIMDNPAIRAVHYYHRDAAVFLAGQKFMAELSDKPLAARSGDARFLDQT